MENINRLIDCLSETRKQKSISLRELSTSTGVSAKHISNIENFKTVPTIRTLEKIAAGLDVKFEIKITA